jgi:hypothetical protein
MAQSPVYTNMQKDSIKRKLKKQNTCEGLLPTTSQTSKFQLQAVESHNPCFYCSNEAVGICDFSTCLFCETNGCRNNFCLGH